MRKNVTVALLEHWPDAVLLADANGVIEYVNRAFERLTGYRASEALGRTPALLSSGRHDRAFYARLWSQLRRGRAFRGVFLNRRKNGELFHEEETIRPLRGASGRIERFVCAGRDVSALMRELQRLKQLATHDALTRLPNRALYADRLTQALHDAQRRREGVAIAMLDLDDFKRINTHYGHLAGDAALRALAARMRRCLRAIDTVARIGGDEFALILPGVGSRNAAAKVFAKIRTANALPLRYRGKRIALAVSIGACFFPRNGRSDQTLRRRADAAMYEAKKAGGNGWRFAR